ncbi:MAG: hypothetical protein ACI83D_000027 [Planctomycetota bacterium]|jgi:hypothetical protein
MKLLFVYNADGDIGSKIKDFGVKIFKPSEYQCQLCSVTYGAFSMKKEWKKYLAEAGFEVEFLHRDEFKIKHNRYADVPLPAVFTVGSNGGLRPYVTGNEFDQISTLSDLQERLETLIHKGN